MLLNEVQTQAAEIRDLKQQVAELNYLTLEIRSALAEPENKDQLLAQRGGAWRRLVPVAKSVGRISMAFADALAAMRLDEVQRKPIYEGFDIAMNAA
jgi:hypothetical protein